MDSPCMPLCASASFSESDPCWTEAKGVNLIATRQFPGEGVLCTAEGALLAHVLLHSQPRGLCLVHATIAERLDPSCSLPQLPEFCPPWPLLLGWDPQSPLLSFRRHWWCTQTGCSSRHKSGRELRGSDVPVTSHQELPSLSSSLHSLALSSSAVFPQRGPRPRASSVIRTIYSKVAAIWEGQRGSGLGTVTHTG